MKDYSQTEITILVSSASFFFLLFFFCLFISFWQFAEEMQHMKLATWALEGIVRVSLSIFSHYWQRWDDEILLELIEELRISLRWISTIGISTDAIVTWVT